MTTLISSHVLGTTYVILDVKKSEKKFPWWIVVVTLIVSIAVLVILMVILYKRGFFTPRSAKKMRQQEIDFGDDISIDESQDLSNDGKSDALSAAWSTYCPSVFLFWTKLFETLKSYLLWNLTKLTFWALAAWIFDLSFFRKIFLSTNWSIKTFKCFSCHSNLICWVFNNRKLTLTPEYS